ncbi:MAG: aminotransferase class I/II-fold pyridoxal phosphate-dependent enzyme [Candidatus Eisenbacteria bacterium]
MKTAMEHERTHAPRGGGVLESPVRSVLRVEARTVDPDEAAEAGDVGVGRASEGPVDVDTSGGPRAWEDCYDPGGGDLFAKARLFQSLIAREHAEGNDFFRRPLLGANRARTRIRDPRSGREREVIMLGSNSYLGLNSDPRVVAAALKATATYGYGSGSVSLYAGTTDLHIELEKSIARFYRCEDAILFPTGYAANIGALSALLRGRDAAVNDLFNHASIYDGCALSGAQVHTYAHASMTRLERVLARVTGPDHGTLVITDGVFSMEGSVAPLDQIVAAARRHGARVMIDEAHATGVIGPTGRGTAELFGLAGEIDVTVGTLSKVPGGIGGYVTGSRELIDYLRYYARTFFFSTSLPAPVVAGLIEVFRILSTDLSLHAALWENIRYLKAGLSALGFDLGNSASAILPVIVRDEGRLKAMLRDLLEAGIFANFVAYPAVPRRRCRLRLGVMAQHTRADLDYVIETFGRIGRVHGVIDGGGR